MGGPSAAIVVGRAHRPRRLRRAGPRRDLRGARRRAGARRARDGHGGARLRRGQPRPGRRRRASSPTRRSPPRWTASTRHGGDTDLFWTDVDRSVRWRRPARWPSRWRCAAVFAVAPRARRGRGAAAGDRPAGGGRSRRATIAERLRRRAALARGSALALRRDSAGASGVPLGAAARAGRPARPGRRRPAARRSRPVAARCRPRPDRGAGARRGGRRRPRCPPGAGRPNARAASGARCRPPMGCSARRRRPPGPGRPSRAPRRRGRSRR